MSEARTVRRAMNRRTGAVWEQRGSGNRWKVIEAKGGYVEVGDTMPPDDGEKQLKQGYWKELPFDLSTLDTAGVFHVEESTVEPSLYEEFVSTPEGREAIEAARIEIAQEEARYESEVTRRVTSGNVSLEVAMRSLFFLGDNPHLEICNVDDKKFLSRVVSGSQEMPWVESEFPHDAIYQAMLAWDERVGTQIERTPAAAEPSEVPQVANESAELTTLRERLAAAEEERDEPKASFDLEDDGTPEYGTPAYELFDKAITWTVHQLKNVLGVKEWSTSGGGTDTLDGDLRMELNDLLKAAGRDDDSMEALRSDLARAKDALIHIGSFFGCSAHLPWFSDDACDEVSAMIDEKGGEKRYDPAFYETYCAQVIADIVTGALSASAGGEGAEKDGAK